jgi:hypothetical protein
MHVIRGAKAIYELQPGEDYRLYKDLIVVAHPDRPPKIIYSDGTVEVLNHAPTGRPG